MEIKAFVEAEVGNRFHRLHAWDRKAHAWGLRRAALRPKRGEYNNGISDRHLSRIVTRT